MNNLSLAGDDIPQSPHASSIKGVFFSANAKQEDNEGSVWRVAWWKDGFTSLICRVIEVEKGLCVWCDTLIAREMAAIFHPGFFEVVHIGSIFGSGFGGVWIFGSPDCN